ncbi:uncharacterized protein LOC125544311 isoform X2 [Triticum urartu]|uniref:uncharacterized protein LOC125532235 isoform X2 n=1 Tax=Triticum urartu TaxID=4572 RepID=UPI002043085F|nr:uncharacterized protein LOC125532235 isoform X2 [Triticum urartu]XP_048563905.1 uncharacterized protein LOC125544311 isoform X2 [Triticum urartu]
MERLKANHRAIGMLVTGSPLRFPRPRELHHLRLCLKILPKLEKPLFLEMLLTLHPQQMKLSKMLLLLQLPKMRSTQNLAS